MNTRSSPPDARPAGSRLTVRLAGLAVALLPLIPTGGSVETAAVVPVAAVDAPAPEEAVRIGDEPVIGVPAPIEGTDDPAAPEARGGERAASGPGSVHVQAGAVRVVQD